MKLLHQDLDEIVASLTEMGAEWLDPTGSKIIVMLAGLADRTTFDRQTLASLLASDFENALTIFRLFLELSKDQLETALPAELGAGGTGVKRYRANPEFYLDGSNVWACARQ